MASQRIDPARLLTLEFFNGVDNAVLNQLAEILSVRTLNENEILFKQGDPSDVLYILLTGSLYAFIHRKNGLHFIGKIHPGETVGEMGFLSGESRSLTVQSMIRSELLVLNSHALNFIFQASPSAAQLILGGIIRRSQHILKIVKTGHAVSEGQLVVLTAATDPLVLHDMVQRLKTKQSASHFFILDDQDLAARYRYSGENAIIRFLSDLEDQYRLTIYPTLNLNSEHAKLVFKKASRFAVLGAGNQPPAFDESVLAILRQTNLLNVKYHPIKKELILVWPAHHPIQRTRFWLKNNRFNMHYHIYPTDEDLDRLIRFWSNRATGLVLSGGAARGWVHIGVLKALQEKNITIDAFGGTSVGAAAAACFMLSEQNIESTINKMTEISQSVLKDIGWRSLTVPLISFYDGFFVTMCLQKVFDDLRVEDLPFPFFAIGTIIPENKEIVLRRGKVWKTIRASAALPGFFPPVVRKGSLIYDGGLTNNLPIDHMRYYLGPTACVIGSNLLVKRTTKIAYSFPPALPFWKALLYRFKLSREKYILPPFLQTVISALLAGSFEKSISNAKLADFCINLEINEEKIISFESYVYTKLIMLGYQAAMQRADEIVVKQQTD